MGETYQKVAYIALRKEDGSLLVGVPLYIKLIDIDGLDCQDEIIHKISEEMMDRYQRQFSEYVSKLKKIKTEEVLRKNKLEEERKNHEIA